MTKDEFARIRALGREERIIFFRDHKSEVLSLSDLDKVNGGTALRGGEGLLNPGSMQTLFQGNFFSSFGYICDGTEFC